MSTLALPAQREQLVGWACAQAAANHSVSDCAACEWWAPPALAPAQPRPLPPVSASPELAWFICLTAPTDDERSSAHLDFARASIVSARLNAPNLAPHVIFLQTPDSQPGGPQSASARFLAWLRRASVRVVPHNLSFFDLIPPSKQRKPGGGGTGHLNVGAYCRLDVPQIVEELAPELAARGIERERVLYTDTDVLFAADFEYARATRALPLPTFAAGSEVFSAAMNSGVMLINATTLRAELPAMLRYATKRSFRFLTLDQTWLAEWFAAAADLAAKGKPPRAATPGWRPLDDDVYNARAFHHPTRRKRRGSAADAADAAVAEPRVWHWHGYKPHDVACWLRAMQSGVWPARGWRDTKVPCRRGRCRWKPIHGSGCRYFGRIEMSPCYLRTYTYLLTQHLRMLSIADGLDT